MGCNPIDKNVIRMSSSKHSNSCQSSLSSHVSDKMFLDHLRTKTSDICNNKITIKHRDKVENELDRSQSLTSDESQLLRIAQSQMLELAKSFSTGKVA